MKEPERYVAHEEIFIRSKSNKGYSNKILLYDGSYDQEDCIWVVLKFVEDYLKYDFSAVKSQRIHNTYLSTFNDQEFFEYQKFSNSKIVIFQNIRRVLTDISISTELIIAKLSISDIYNKYLELFKKQVQPVPTHLKHKDVIYKKKSILNFVL